MWTAAAELPTATGVITNISMARGTGTVARMEFAKICTNTGTNIYTGIRRNTGTFTEILTGIRTKEVKRCAGIRTSTHTRTFMRMGAVLRRFGI